MTPGEAISGELRRLYGEPSDRGSLRDLYHQLGGAKGGGTRHIAEALGLPLDTPQNRNASYRRLQRYMAGEGKEQRGVKKPDPTITAGLRRLQIHTAAGRIGERGLSVAFDGMVNGPSDDNRNRRKQLTIPPGQRLDELLAAHAQAPTETQGQAFANAFFAAWRMPPGFALGDVSQLELSIPAR